MVFRYTSRNVVPCLQRLTGGCDFSMETLPAYIALERWDTIISMETLPAYIALERWDTIISMETLPAYIALERWDTITVMGTKLHSLTTLDMLVITILCGFQIVCNITKWKKLTHLGLKFMDWPTYVIHGIECPMNKDDSKFELLNWVNNMYGIWSNYRPAWTCNLCTCLSF